MSTMISIAGLQLAIWRHSSEPMDPPPPVTMMRLPPTNRVMRLESCTSSRPRRSSTFTSRMRLARSLPSVIIFTMSGKIFTLHLVRLQMDSTRRRFSSSMVGMASRMVSISQRSTSSGMSSVVPMICTPMM